MTTTPTDSKTPPPATRGRCSYRQADLTRSLRGARAAGERPRFIRHYPDGTFDVFVDEPPADENPAGGEDIVL
jgi:hypothetical protein